MKASIKFREEQSPMVRAKIPISVLSFPFVSGLAVGDARDLRFDLATAFDAGPAVRVSYRPNDSVSPFAVVIKTGVGTFGSPDASSPLAMTAEFSFLGRAASSSSPAFSIIFKPRFGDFSIKKTIKAPPAVFPVSTPANKVVSIEGGSIGIDSVNAGETPLVTFKPFDSGSAHDREKRFPGNLAAAAVNGSVGDMGTFLSGTQLSAKSILPLFNHAAVRFNWALRIPLEVDTALSERAERPAEISKIPLMFLNKITFEHRVDCNKTKKNKQVPVVETDGTADTCSIVKQQLDRLELESGLLRKNLEELRADIAAGKMDPFSLGGQISAVNSLPKMPPVPIAGDRDRLGNGVGNTRNSDNSVKPKQEQMLEELKKAADARRKAN